MCDLDEGDMVGSGQEVQEERGEREESGTEGEGEKEEEGHRPKYRIVSDKPSQREVDEHMVTHVPFRDWCPHCVRGKSKSTPHRRRKEGGEEEVPVISVDYMFMESEDRETGIGMPILVSRDRQSKWVNAAVVPQKGNCAYAVKRLAAVTGFAHS